MYRHVQIEITNRCSLKCRECPHRYLKRRKTDMSQEVFTAVLEKFVVGKQVDSLIYNKDGEPFLHPDFQSWKNPRP